MKMKFKISLKWILALVGMVAGIFIAMQVRSYAEVEDRIRDTDAGDIFHEIYALRTANESLKDEISALEARLEQYSTQTSGYATMNAEIEKNEILLGYKPIQGPGVQITVNAGLGLEEFVDTTNELWAAGAEAVVVNGVRLIDATDGFYTINDMVLLNGEVLAPPYTFNTFGDATVLWEILNQPGGVISRFENTYPDGEISVQVKENL
jgi:uncharacterized protein YlxW (UPF0749 family)